MFSVLEVSRDIIAGTLALEAVSVHSDAVNCADGRGRRVSLIENPDDFQPRSILVRDLPRVSPGDRFSIGTAAAVRSYDPRIGRRIALGARWHGLFSEWADFIGGGELAMLGEALLSGSVAGLCGLGPGLTPAGDDFIAGWLAGRVAARDRTSVRRFRGEWRAGATTWFSAWMIEDSARGKIWRRGRELLDGLSEGDAARAASAAAKILNWGHTSGAAWLAGLAGSFLAGGA